MVPSFRLAPFRNSEQLRRVARGIRVPHLPSEGSTNCPPLPTGPQIERTIHILHKPQTMCNAFYSYCVPLCVIQVSYTPHTIHHLNAPSESRIKNSQGPSGRKRTFASISHRSRHPNIKLISYKHVMHYLNPQLSIRLYLLFLSRQSPTNDLKGPNHSSYSRLIRYAQTLKTITSTINNL